MKPLQYLMLGVTIFAALVGWTYFSHYQADMKAKKAIEKK